MFSFQNVIKLSDGWYEIKASLDQPLVAFIEQGKIKIGTKLCVYGAELIGSAQACTPLQVLYRKLCSNILNIEKFDFLHYFDFLFTSRLLMSSCSHCLQIQLEEHYGIVSLGINSRRKPSMCR